MLAVIDAGLAPQFAPMSMLECGCGLGRLALPLARRPGSVTAVDRSPVMLDLARREAERRGLGHIAFETPADLFAAPRRFDLVVCYHVLQRLPPVEAMALAAPPDRPDRPRRRSASFSGRTGRTTPPRPRLALAARTRARRQRRGEPAPRQACRRSVHADARMRADRDAARVRFTASFDRRTWRWSITSTCDYAIVLAQRSDTASEMRARHAARLAEATASKAGGPERTRRRRTDRSAVDERAWRASRRSGRRARLGCTEHRRRVQPGGRRLRSPRSPAGTTTSRSRSARSRRRRRC